VSILALHVARATEQIVEELEDRLGDQMEEILSHVQSAFPLSSTTVMVNGDIPCTDLTFGNSGVEQWDPLTYPEGDEEVIFDDTGEGAGVEGDLDMNDD
jgi:hypothetical protein